MPGAPKGGTYNDFDTFFSCGDTGVPLTESAPSGPDCTQLQLSPSQTWLSGDVTRQHLGTGIYLQTDPFIEFDIAGTTYNTDSFVDCGVHSMSADLTNTPFLLDTQGKLTLDPSKSWPALPGGSEQYSFDAKVRFAGLLNDFSKKINFSATTSCEWNELDWVLDRVTDYVTVPSNGPYSIDENNHSVELNNFELKPDEVKTACASKYSNVVSLPGDTMLK